MTEREGGETTADLVDAITRTYRERKDAEPAADGAASGDDAERQADALADHAARLAEMLAAITAQPRRSLNPVAVFLDLGRAAGSIAAAAGELRRQGWVDPDDEEAREAWYAALAGLRAAEGTFTRVAEGRI